jgi:signal transduction histidine kinase
LRRNVRLLIPHTITLALAFYLHRSFLAKTPYLVLAYVVIILSIVIRLFLLKKYMKQDGSKPSTLAYYNLFVMLTGLGWGVVFWIIHGRYGNLGIHSLFMLGVIITFISGGVTSLAPSFVSGLIYISSLALLPFFIYVTNSSFTSYILSFLLLANVIYQIFHLYVSHKYLIESLQNELNAIRQREILQDLMDGFPGLVLVFGKAERYQMVNNFRDGFYKKRLLGKEFDAYLPESEMVAIFRSFLKGTEKYAVHEVKSAEPGANNWFMLNLSRINSPEETVIAYIAPIDELVKAKNDLKIHEARTLYASKLASLGEMAAGIAHEVNNPLTIIEGAANLMKVVLEENPNDKSSLLRAANKIMDTTHRIARIIKSLRMLSGDAEAEPFKNVTIEEIIEPCLEISKSKLEAHNIQLKVNAGNNSVALFGNEIQLGQVLMNLVANAIDAVKDCPEPRWIEIRYEPTFEWLDILVVDSGNGVSSENVSKIMEPFFTTKDRSQGTGLGLSISKSIVEMHHGTLGMVTEAKHTTFRIRLPRMNPWSNVKKSS